MAGSGISTKEILIELGSKMRMTYSNELAKLPMKKGTRETLVDGFADGWRTCWSELVKMGIVELVESEPEHRGSRA